MRVRRALTPVLTVVLVAVEPALMGAAPEFPTKPHRG